MGCKEKYCGAKKTIAVSPCGCITKKRVAYWGIDNKNFLSLVIDESSNVHAGIVKVICGIDNVLLELAFYSLLFSLTRIEYVSERVHCCFVFVDHSPISEMSLRIPWS